VGGTSHKLIWVMSEIVSSSQKGVFLCIDRITYSLVENIEEERCSHRIP